MENQNNYPLPQEVKPFPLIKVILAGLASLLIALAALWPTLTDWWYINIYQPPPEIASIAAATGMSNRGKIIFYKAQPQIESKEAFEGDCQFEIQVLGCYISGRNKIFILDIKNTEIEQDVENVTGAHEMLHSAYSSMNAGERRKIDEELEKEFSKITDEELIETIRRTPESNRINELHSHIGTEIVNVSPILEKYYQKYFTYRSKVVAANVSFKELFQEVAGDINARKAELDGMRVRLDMLAGRIDSGHQEIATLDQLVDVYERTNDPDSYYPALERRNNLAASVNRDVGEYNTLRLEYNSKVDLFNQRLEYAQYLDDSLKGMSKFETRSEK